MLRLVFLFNYPSHVSRLYFDWALYTFTTTQEVARNSMKRMGRAVAAIMHIMCFDFIWSDVY